jgi:hypothetical protein
MYIALSVLAVAFSAGCGPQASADDVPNISMKIGDLNPVEVGVLTPSEKFIFLRSDESTCQGLVIKDGVLLIDSSIATGYYWDAEGERNAVAVFSEIGTYTIYAADNLETEFDNSSAISRQYINKRKRSIDALNTCKPL